MVSDDGKGDPSVLDDVALDAAVEAQRARIAAFEEQFVPMRRQYEALRGRLRALDAEREKRRLAAAGEVAGFKPIPRRSYTLADVLAGREKNVALDTPLPRFGFASMRRQTIVLHPEGVRDDQRLTFHRPGAASAAPETATATTFGEARRLLAEGWTQGVPGVAMSRLAVYYPETETTGWLRADQIYVEEPLA